MAQEHSQRQANPLPPHLEEMSLSMAHKKDVAPAPSHAEFVSMRQMMETLLSRIDSLQQNQAVQFAGVNDRLDAVELELPLIQEQSALRMRDLETRVTSHITSQVEEAAKAAVEEATVGLHERVAGKFGSLEAQIENQNRELAEMRDSRKTVEDRLSRAVLDIERLCGSLGPKPVEEVYRAALEVPASPFRSRIAEQIRKAALEAAPYESNPLIGDPQQKKVGAELLTAVPAAALEVIVLSEVQPVPEVRDEVVPPVEPLRTPSKPVQGDGVVPGFDDWKRQFMQDGEPLLPSLGTDGRGEKVIVCPRCYSERTRRATRTKLDELLRLTGFAPYRCRSCAHRFYKRGAALESSLNDDHGDPHNEEVLETR